MNNFLYWKNPAPVPELDRSSFQCLSRFPSLSFLDSVELEGPTTDSLAGNMEPVGQAPVAASPAMSPFQGSNKGLHRVPSMTTQTPGRVPSRRPPMTQGVPPIKWKVLDPPDDAQDGNSSNETPMADEDEAAEYDSDSDTSHYEVGKENSSPSPTRSAEFSKVLSLKPTKKRRTQGSRKTETTYGRLPRGEQDLINKARIKELVAMHETHKAKVKNGIPSAKEAKRASEGKLNLETAKKATATEDKVWQCEVCMKMFGQKSTLKQHARIHLDPNKHACTTCEKTFRNAENLAAHQRSHLGQNPYMCTTCDKGFLLKANFQRHCSTHDVPKAPKPYACSFCSASYANKGPLSRHLKLKHANEPEVPKPLDMPVME